MKRTLTSTAAFLLILLVAACGPKNGKGLKDPGDDHGDDVIHAQGGDVSSVSEEVREGFKEAVQVFVTHEKANDWTTEICEDLDKKFREVNKETEKETGKSLVKAIYNVGVVWQKCGDHKKAWAVFDEAQKLDKKNNEGKETFQRPMVQMGTYKLALYLKDGKQADLNEAKAKFQQAIDIDPLSEDVVEAYVNLAMIQRLEAKGNVKLYEEALKNLQRALVIDSKSLDAFLQMAELYREQATHEKDDSKIDLAVLVISQAQLIEAEKGESFPPLNLTLGLLKMERGDIIGALKNFKVAYEKDDELFEAFMNYGAITIGFRGYEDAEMVFGRALELKPDSYMAHMNLGIAKRGLEKYAEAEAEYQKAMDIEPNNPDAYYNMGLLYQDYYYEKAGDSGYANFEIAMEWYKKFKTKAGTSKDYEQKVKDADERIKNSQKAIELMKEAASLMAEAEAMAAEADAEAPPPDETAPEAATPAPDAAEATGGGSE